MTQPTFPTGWDEDRVQIVYVFEGVIRRFRPDFLVRLANGTMLVLGVKGQDSAQNSGQAQRVGPHPWPRRVG